MARMRWTMRIAIACVKDELVKNAKIKKIYICFSGKEEEGSYYAVQVKKVFFFPLFFSPKFKK